MLHKVLKELKKQEKIDGKILVKSYEDLDTINPTNSGFHAKANSEAGAYRQRSMGNRNTKPSR